MARSVSLAVLGAQHAMACENGQEGIGYQNNSSTEAATVVVKDTSSNTQVYSVTVNAGSYYEFCWTTTADTYQINQSFATAGSSYLQFSADDFKTNNYFINVSSNQATPGWTTEQS